MTVSYGFDFDQRFTGPLRLLGIRPVRSHVILEDGQLEARFGPWVVETPLTNVESAEITGPHNPLKAIGPRFSPSTRSLTFGSNPRRFVRIDFDETVAGLEPLGIVRHPSLSVSVTDPEGLRNRLQTDMAHPA